MAGTAIHRDINDTSPRFSILLVLLALTACGGGRGASPPPTGPAQISTFAYVMNECEVAPGAGTGPLHQALWIRQGDGAPVQIAEFTLPTYPRNACLGYGQDRSGQDAVFVGAFQRLGRAPDASIVVFEVTDQFSPLRGFVPRDQRGFFVVRADGSGLRRIADASLEASFAADWNCILVGGSTCQRDEAIWLDFSPDGRLAVITDKGPASTGTLGGQIFTLDLTTGERTQLTFLPPLPRCREPIDPNAECVQVGQLPIFSTRFLDAQTIAFYRREGASTIVPYTVDIQSHELKPVQVVPIPGGGLVPIFHITGEPLGFTVFLPDRDPVNGPGPFGDVVEEAFNFNGQDTLQLTAFGRSDTFNTRTTLDQARVLFLASADPLGTNLKQACEVFSIDPLGGDLRQLTHFGADITEGRNCTTHDPPPTCTLGDMEVDRGTGSVVFISSCDPLGINPYGEQEFAMRPDGTGLRQLTAARGLRQGADGSLAVELPGPWAVPSRLR